MSDEQHIFGGEHQTAQRSVAGERSVHFEYGMPEVTYWIDFDYVPAHGGAQRLSFQLGITPDEDTFTFRQRDRGRIFSFRGDYVHGLPDGLPDPQRQRLIELVCQIRQQTAPIFETHRTAEPGTTLEFSVDEDLLATVIELAELIEEHVAVPSLLHAESDNADDNSGTSESDNADDADDEQFWHRVRNSLFAERDRRTAATLQTNSDAAVVADDEQNNGRSRRASQRQRNRPCQLPLSFNLPFSEMLANFINGAHDVDRCGHANKQYDSPSDVPFYYCERCESIVAPIDRRSVAAQVVPVPFSLRRDERWKRLFDVYVRHEQVLRDVQRLQERYTHLVVRLTHWRDAFGTGRPNDVYGADNMLFDLLDRGVKRYLNSVSGFRRLTQNMLAEHRHALIARLSAVFPQSVGQFVTAMRSEIERMQPNPMLYPTNNGKCSMCMERDVDVRLHRRKPSTEAPCRCVQLLLCIDCLLRWYWESSEQLKKSFATCPTCRASFQLEDIVRIHWPFVGKEAELEQRQQSSADGAVQMERIGALQQWVADHNNSAHEADATHGPCDAVSTGSETGGAVATSVESRNDQMTNVGGRQRGVPPDEQT